MREDFERITVIKQQPDGKLQVHQGWRRKAIAKPRKFLDPDAQPILKETK